MVNSITHLAVVVEVSTAVIARAFASTAQNDASYPVGSSVVDRTQVFSWLVDGDSVGQQCVKGDLDVLTGRQRVGEGPLQQRLTRAVVIGDHFKSRRCNAPALVVICPGTNRILNVDREQVDHDRVLHRHRTIDRARLQGVGHHAARGCDALIDALGQMSSLDGLVVDRRTL